MPDELLPESFDFSNDGVTEFRSQMLRIRGALESLALDLATADSSRPQDEIADLPYRRHVVRAAALLIRNFPLSASAAPCQVFISYKTEDEPFAQEVHKKLTAKGMQTFLAAVSIDPGSDWEEAVFQALRSCRVAVFLITPSSITSEWCNYEIGAARALEKDVVCALRHVEAKTLPSGLRRFQAIEIQTTRQLNQLIKSLKNKCSD